MKENMFGSNSGNIKIPFTNLYAQYKEAKNDIDTAIKNVLETSSFITGPLVDRFETEMTAYTEAEACASVGSGTNALICSLRATIKPGDEVITTAHTFVSTTESIVLAGGVPVFVDIGDYYHIDIKSIESAITDKTRAILFVDLYGQTPNIDALVELANKHNLFLIEDAAQAFGSSYKNKKIGSLVDLTCFSFNPVKNLGAIGDAGMVTGKKDLIDRVKMYRDHGRSSRYQYDEVGYNMRIDNIQAMVILEKLKYLKGWTEKKQKICRYYSQQLSGVVQVPIENTESEHTYYVYVIRATQRDELQNYLQQKGIQTNIHYRNPTHRTPAYEKYVTTPLKMTEAVCDSILSLPCYHTLTEENQQYIIDSIKEFYDQY
jgi:dTDP-4-amino-4,6-dideoxygalactose transaminase